MVGDEDGRPENRVKIAIPHLYDERFLTLDQCEAVDEKSGYPPLKGGGSEFNGHPVGIVIAPEAFRAPIVITQ
ncbi:MAG: hypothetical protein FGF50_09345 [Candidatus Brockarchaeota archaeon]|nr:hypothetical protein [Candidatus Brockarchaeota archaeon]